TVPALAVQRVAGRGECIQDRVPYVALAIAVEINGVIVEISGQELRIAHGAGPRASHFGARCMTLLQDLQGYNELLPELDGTQAHEGLCGNGGKRVERRVHAAATSLPAPVGDAEPYL